MARQIRVRSLIALLGLLAVACGGGADGGDPGGSDAAGAAPGTTPPASANPVDAIPTPVEGTLTTSDGQRRYLLVEPPGGTQPRPLVIALHDAGGSPEGMIQISQLDLAAQQHGFTVAFPEGMFGGTWNAGWCCNTAFVEGVDDDGFLSALLDELVAAHPVDPDRVYLVGVSAGAVMAFAAGCQMADRVAGIGSMAGAMQLDDCAPSRPLSMIAIHGTADTVVPYEGGPVIEEAQATADAPPARAVADRWAELDGCPGPPAEEVDGVVTTTTWDGCEGDSAVRLISVEGGGHTWYAPGFGPVDGAVDATAEILAFLGLAPDGG